MPPLDGGHHLIDWLHNAGTISQAAMGGAGGLTWLELKAWSDLSGNDLTGWEADTVMHLSRTYAATLAESSDPHYPAPFVPEIVDAVEVGDNLKSKFKALAAQRKR